MLQYQLDVLDASLGVPGRQLASHLLHDSLLAEMPQIIAGMPLCRCITVSDEHIRCVPHDWLQGAVNIQLFTVTYG